MKVTQSFDIKGLLFIGLLVSSGASNAQPPAPLGLGTIGETAAPKAGAANAPSASMVATRKRQVDWEAWKRLRDKGRATEKTQPEAAFADYKGFLVANPQLHPSVTADVVATMVQVRVPMLGDPSKPIAAATDANIPEAVALLDEWEPRVKDDAAGIILLGERARLLLKLNKPKESAALLDANWDRIAADPAAGRSLMRNGLAGLQIQAYAPNAGDVERDTFLQGLQQAVLVVPGYLDPREQATREVYAKMVNELIAAQRPEEALSWARLMWIEAGYDKSALQNASRVVSQAWLAQDPTGAALSAWTKAQTDPVVANGKPGNPLRGVKLPALEVKQLEKRLSERSAILNFKVDKAGETPAPALSPADAATLAAQRQRPAGILQQECISVLLALGRWDRALDESLKLFSELPDNQKRARAGDQALMVCRVLKAADGDLHSANAYLKWLAQPEAERGATPLAAWRARQGAVGPTTAVVEVAAQ